MPANNVNRKTIRNQLGSLLLMQLQTANNFADGKLCARVYSYLVGDFADGLPVVCVGDAPGGGSERMRRTFQALQFDQNWLHFSIVSYVNYGQTDSTWSERQAQDRLDDIETVVANVLSDNKVSVGFWNEILFDGKTTADAAIISGVGYFFENMPVKVRVMQ